MKDMAIQQIENGFLPMRQSPASAAYDLYARTQAEVHPGDTEVIPCGFAIALLPGYVALTCSRTDMAGADRVFVLNAPGIVNSNYREEVTVTLFNASPHVFRVLPGQHIALMLIQAHESPDLVLVKELPDYQTPRRMDFRS